MRIHCQRTQRSNPLRRDLIDQLTHILFSTDVITHIIRHSNIEVIQRLSLDLQTRLIHDLSNISTKACLQGAQLNAFASALSNSIHCTQGPPGTGKMGVDTLTIALEIQTNASQNEHKQERVM